MPENDSATNPSISSTLAQTEHDIQAQLITQINAFAQHTVHVSYMFIGIIIVILALAGIGGYLGLKSYEAQVAKAEAIEQKYIDAQKDFAAQLAAHDAQRTADSQASQVLLAQIAARAKQVPPPAVKEGLKPDATAQEAATALQTVVPALGTLEATPEGKVLATVNQTQILTTSELAGQRAETDLRDTNALLALSKQDNLLLTQDLTQSQAQNAEAQKVIAAYKKIAVKSKWRKFLDGSLKVGIFVAGAAIGHAI